MERKENSLIKIIAPIIVFFIGCGAMYGLIYAFPGVFSTNTTKLEKNVTITDEGIADAVEKVYDSTVIITTYKGDTKYASGSGFIYEIDGKKAYIITNHHVVADGDNYKIKFTNGDEINAKLLGSDQYSDIAVLEVTSDRELEKVIIGKTDSLRVGDTTFTVGAPLDNVYSWTVTRGIISGKERFVEISLSNSYGDDYVMNVLQTDAAVNSGNSGGPLCNSNGEVIGVINAKILQTGVEGMGFAIPIEVAVEKAEQIIRGEESEYPFLGVSMVSVKDASSFPDLARYIDEKTTAGVMIYSVEKNSVAESAKLQKGDIILKINDKDVNTVAYLRYELYKYKVGDKINLTYKRNGVENTVTLKLSSKIKAS